MNVGDLVAYKDQEGSYGLILERKYDLSPPVRGIRFLVKWMDGIGLNSAHGWNTSIDGWFKKESLELLSESR